MEIGRNYAYDIMVNDNKELILTKYMVVDENIKTQNGKIRSYRSYQYLGYEVVDDISLRIDELTLEGYLPVNRFKPMSFDIETFNPLIYTKLMLLSNKCRLLEKMYYIGRGYDANIRTYISYINMYTGKISCMKVGEIGMATPIKIKELELEHYKPFNESYYYALGEENSRSR